MKLLKRLMSLTYKQTALAASTLLRVSLLIAGFATIALGHAAPSVTYGDAFLVSLSIFGLSMLGFSLMPIIMPEKESSESMSEIES